MEFGRVLENELRNVDFTLPENSDFTIETLRSAPTQSDFKIHVGLSKWGHNSWRGVLYPTKIDEKEFLNEYVKHFDSIELNASFYTMYPPDKFASWAAKTAGNHEFKFCPKFPQNISHISRLKGVEKLTDQFYEGISGLGETIGALFLQLGDNFTYQGFDDIKTYLASLPKYHTVFMEVRHKEWFSNNENRHRLFDTMRELGVGTIITDTAGRRDCAHMELTLPKVMLRFIATGIREIDSARIDSWVDRLKQWKDIGFEEGWLFVHGHEESIVPAIADYLIEQLNEKLDAGIKRPRLITDQQQQ